ncbi:phosphoenolpyruvate synthase [Acidaminobacter sp. JC074]|uniref:phosphoenolpyruvate synthase n=1 Tax=Acidaminobacter sp. JC074 TaxID=2530199 RepID=UPI001F0FEB3A|nr:phosphoenolpyruvate synthase [Acidaminobacter sp. JC074]MCH4888111.1 phosphoenolpyruvate synthase [Acidaminobacter sp. JC074]
MYACDLKNNLQVELSDVGAKAYNLMALSSLEGVQVPQGFVVTTKAYRDMVDNHELKDLMNQLAQTNDDKMLKRLSSDVRKIIIASELPGDLLDLIKEKLEKLGNDQAYIIRSSATAEDLPTASFAGLYDSYLNIKGIQAIIDHIKKCWASLYSERALIYQKENGFNDDIYLAVIIQKMIKSQCSGVVFTADPSSSDRKTVSIDAAYGLGEGYVSGHVEHDNYKISNGEITSRNIGVKVKALYARDEVIKEIIEGDLSKRAILSDQQLFEIEALSRKIESHFSCPQDIEWCIDDRLYIVQSRPITRLYPMPEDEGDTRVYMSSGHLQMMTAPIKPLGIFFFKSVISNPPSKMVGGRLYLDLTGDLNTGFGRLIARSLLKVLGDSLLSNAVDKVMKDKKLIDNLAKSNEKVFNIENNSGALSIMKHAYKAYKENDSDIVKRLIEEEESSIEIMRLELEKLSGIEALDYIYKDHDNRRLKLTKPPNAGVLTAAMLSSNWLDKKVNKWLKESHAADSIIMSVPNSVTSETGLSLLDVTDVVRQYPEVIDYLKSPRQASFFEDIEELDGGKKVAASLNDYLKTYGMRCSGDIDITAERWIENPVNLVPVILSNLKNFQAGGSTTKYNQGKEQVEKRLNQLVREVEKLPFGKRKAKKILKVSSRVRNYIGYREYPKFSYMKRYYYYKMAMLKEGERLVDKSILKSAQDIYYLEFDELKDLVSGGQLDYSIIENRKKEYQAYAQLKPPRLLTSKGQVIEGEYDKDVPDNALLGITVSHGIVEGRARVVKAFKDTHLTEGDILVTEFTDPSWTPAFVSIKGLITEVGGLTTHGAVIAREYGLPAIVSVKDATDLIKDGQKIRLNATEGFVEILEE